MPLEGLVQRVTRGIRYAFTGNADWFGPGQPLPPQAPAEVEGRQWQMPISYNTLIQTKTTGIGFGTLRRLADTTDIIRLLIEERKDQLCALDWSVQKKDTNLRGRGKPTEDPKAKEITKFLQSPDQTQPWHLWLRMLLEDMYVIDAATLYIQRTKGGKLYALRPIDGSTIKRLIDGHGWTPAPPLPAYQQILNGIVASDYTNEDMLYLARNMRTNHIYGFSHVEQIIVMAKTWLARQASNLEYYDKGSVPDGFLSASKDWGAQEIARYQELFDLQLSGQLGERRKIKVTPNDSKFTPTKEPALKSDYDEWLVRIACFCFSVPPIPFIKEMTRATADQSASQSQSGGLEYDRKWLERMMTSIIARQLDAPDYEFTFRDREAQDPLERAQVDQIYVTAGVLKANEVRADLGLDPLPEPEPTQPGAQEPKPGAPKPPGEDDAAKSIHIHTVHAMDAREFADVLKRQTGHRHLHKAAEPMTEPMRKLKGSFALALGETRDAVLKQVAGVHKAAGGDGSRDIKHAVEWGTFADRVDLSALSLAWDDYSDTLVAVAPNGAKETIAQLVSDNPGLDTSSLFGVDSQAVAWADEHAAEMLGSNGTGGKLAEATRDMLRHALATAVGNGDTDEAIAKMLNGAYAFSEDRAELIARTEVRNAQGAGALIGAKAVGMTTKKWLLSNDEGICPLCEANAAQGWIAIGKAFVSGAEHPLQHPRCRCDVAYGDET